MTHAILKENRRLMDTVRKQSLSLRTMEMQYPGISKIKRDPGGAIIIDEDIFLKQWNRGKSGLS